MRKTFCIFDGTGKLSAETLLSLLRENYVENVVCIGDEPRDVNEKRIIIVEGLRSREDEIDELNEKIREQAKDISAMEASMSKAFTFIQAAQTQQKESSQELSTLKKRVEAVKQQLTNVLWTHCAPHHPEMRHIPPMEDSEAFLDTNTQIGGIYNVGSFLGEGQYASVLEATRIKDKQVFALKIVNKIRIASFPAMRRMSTEIETLKKLRSKFIVSLQEVIHTSTKLYIVMERGGPDLFEFFGRYSKGVADEWALQIVYSLISAIRHCHNHGYCHRDLKPENVLMNFDSKNGRCIDMKLCDFGLAAKFKEKVTLADFCGSPGFFDPEMVIEGVHFGDKADIWSLGCIILELVLGHQKFCDHWMKAYEHELIRDKAAFTTKMIQTVSNLKNVLNFSNHFADFVLKILVVQSSRRLTIPTMLKHPWMRGISEDGRVYEESDGNDDLRGHMGRDNVSATQLSSPPSALLTSIQSGSGSLRKKLFEKGREREEVNF